MFTMYSTFIFIIFLGTIATEALTELLVKSSVFFPLREFFDKRAKSSRVCEFLSNLLFCGYCTSVWVAFFTVLLMFLFIDVLFINKFADFVLCFLTIHRLSNILHFVIDYLDKKRV